VPYFGPFNPFHYSPSPFTSHHPFFNSFQYTCLYPLPSHLMFCDITDALSFSFPCLLSPSPTEQSYYYKHVHHLRLHMVMLAFVYMFIFWIYLPHVRENTWPLSFWAWLTSLNMIALQLHVFTSKPHVIIPYGWVKIHCVHKWWIGF
jgi:hypothetical protein